MNRRGFTLVELMVAAAIGCLIATATYVFFSGSGRMSREGYGEICGALSNRVDREKGFVARAQILERAGRKAVNPPVGDALMRATEDGE